MRGLAGVQSLLKENIPCCALHRHWTLISQVLASPLSIRRYCSSIFSWSHWSQDHSACCSQIFLDHVAWSRCWSRSSHLFLWWSLSPWGFLVIHTSQWYMSVFDISQCLTNLSLVGISVLLWLIELFKLCESSFFISGLRNPQRILRIKWHSTLQISFKVPGV